MPVLTQTPLISYTGNGSATVYPYPFQILTANDLDVFVNGSITTAYTLSGVGSTSGGNVTFTVAPSNGAVVRIIRNTDISRDTDYVEGGSVPAVTLDTDFDRIVMMIQELNTTAIKETSNNVFDAEGKRIINLGAPIDSTDAADKSYLDTVVADAAASAAAALASEVSAASTLDTFDDRYLGPKSDYPSVDNDGNTLLVGALFFHTGNHSLYAWTGTVWTGSTFLSSAGANKAYPVNVKDYGATGQGIVDDYAAIQLAIDSNPGSSIYFPPGVYNISTTITVHTDNTRLVGSGSNCTYIRNNTVDDDAIHFYCTSTATTTTFLNGVGLTGLYVYRNTAATTGASIRITQVNGGVFEDFISSNCPEGVAVEGGQFNRFNRFNLFATGGTFDLTAVTNSCLMSFRETPIDGGLYQAVFTTTITDFRTTSSKKTECIFCISSADGLQFSNAYVASAKYSMVKIIGLRNGGKVAGLNFSNIYFDAVNGITGTEYIVDVPADAYSSFYVYDASFTGCIFGNTKSGGIVARKSIHKLLVTGCTFLNINTWPIDFEGEATSSNVNITGNQFNYVGVLGTGTGATRIKDVMSLVYSGNTIVNDIGVGATLNLTGTINVASVTGNTVKANTADITFSGATFTTGLTISGNISTSTNGTNSWRGNKYVNLAVTDTKTFDWYEEGTFTPGITFGGNAVGVTYSTQIGRFTRFGNRVIFNIAITLTSKGSSVGSILLTNLPYTSNANNIAPCSIRLNGVTSGLANVMLYGLVPASVSTVQLAKSDGATSLTVLADTDIAGTASIYVSGQYEVA